jgi:hypothetical protein
VPLHQAVVIAVNGTVDEDAKMNCQDAFWVVDRLVNVAGRPMVHKGVHMYLEYLGDPNDPDDDEMSHVGRVVSAQEARNRTVGGLCTRCVSSLTHNLRAPPGFNP